MTDQTPETPETVPHDDPAMLALAALLDGTLGEGPTEGPAEIATEDRETRCDQDPLFDPDNKPEDVELIKYLMQMVGAAISYMQAPPFVRPIIASMAHQAFHEETDPEIKAVHQRTAMLFKVIEFTMSGGG